MDGVITRRTLNAMIDKLFRPLRGFGCAVGTKFESRIDSETWMQDMEFMTATLSALVSFRNCIYDAYTSLSLVLLIAYVCY